MATTDRPPAPPDAASTRAPKGFYWRFTGGSLGIWAALMGPAMVGMYLRVTQIAPADTREAVYSMIVGVGSAVALFCNPLWGRLSDRTRSRWGRRVPWIAGGTLAGIAGLALIVATDAVWSVLAGWVMAQAGLNAALAALTATIPDEVPVHQRGKFSGAVGATLTTGILIASFIGAVTQNVYILFLVPAALAAVLVGQFVLAHRESASHERPGRFTVKDFLFTFVFNPVAHPDFGWAWLSKFLVMGGQVFIMLTIAFFVEHTLGYSPEKTTQTVAVLMIGNYVLQTLLSLAGGPLSDRLGRRKPLVIGSALLLAAALGLLATAQSLPVIALALALFAVGGGLFYAVDMALVTQVLPDPEQPAKDLGIANMANALPQPIVAAAFPLILAVGGGDNYTLLYGVAAALTVLGAITVQPIRSVK
ncbi:MFS transporter [Salininema proteolyticum]|uniref:MFS transporter n=1 Tax=Salininema proteolyticum TaxID=1607685 RepID=A0ABV8TVP4_9ACTN